jgi:hypothetical protein
MSKDPYQGHDHEQPGDTSASDVLTCIAGFVIFTFLSFWLGSIQAAFELLVVAAVVFFIWAAPKGKK